LSAIYVVIVVINIIPNYSLVTKKVTEKLTFKRVQILFILRDRFPAFTCVALTTIINKTILGGCKVQKGWLELEEKLQIQLRLATQSN
jgi:hypothetical protein